MNKRVRKAVFPAGGLGTRFLPATKVIPKEMLALVDKPIIQYGVEEAIASGIEHIIIITGRGKGAMEDHFDHSFELDATLERRGKHELLAVSRGVASIGAHQLRAAKGAAGPGPRRALRQGPGGRRAVCRHSARRCDRRRAAVPQADDRRLRGEGRLGAGDQTIEGPAISAYGVLAGSQDRENPRIYNCTGMVEKPKFEDAPSKQAIIGRYVLTPRVFELLEQTKPGAGGEIQLTDGIKALLKEEKVFGYTFEGKRFDAGDKFGMLQATVEFALKRPEFGEKFRAYLKGLNL